MAYDPKRGTAVIIDYKTGEDHPQYETQIRRYTQTLEQTGWKVEKSFFGVYQSADYRKTPVETQFIAS